MTKVMNIIRRIRVKRTLLLERRLHKRAMLYWHTMRRDREFVLLSEFDPLSLEDRSSHGFLLDLTDQFAPMLRYIGPILREEAAVTAKVVALKGVCDTSLLSRFASRFPEVLELRKPVTAEYDFVTGAGYRVLCRGALVPLSSDGITLDHVYGVISWKSEKVRN